MLWLLLASVIFVPIFQKIPGGSPVLGYLAAGILIGPYGLSIIRHVHGPKAIAEFGVVFLLFNIGLELSVERLSSMKKYVFGLGSAQVLVTSVVAGLVAHFIAGQLGPAAIVIGNGLALSSTAVVLQDLAVVVLLILILLISPNSSKGGVGFQAIAEALGLAAVKAIVAITAIIVGGRLVKWAHSIMISKLGSKVTCLCCIRSKVGIPFSDETRVFPLLRRVDELPQAGIPFSPTRWPLLLFLQKKNAIDLSG